MGNTWIQRIKPVSSEKFTFEIISKSQHAISNIPGKEARKKELKKNKKQRQMVRAAVLKGKDPAQLLDEMEKIDEMGRIICFFPINSTNLWLFLEYNVFQPSPLNEKVLREKRKKLKETLDRVMRLYVSFYYYPQNCSW